MTQLTLDLSKPLPDNLALEGFVMLLFSLTKGDEYRFRRFTRAVSLEQRKVADVPVREEYV